MKKSIWWMAMAIAVSIFMTGCAVQRKSVPDMENSSETGEAAQTTSEMTTNEDPETSEPSVSSEVPAETADASEMNTPETESGGGTSPVPNVPQTSEQAVSEPPKQVSPKSEPPANPTEPVQPQIPVQAAEKPEQTGEPEPPAAVSAPESAEPEPPPFDIQHWIAYAKSYAQSVGLCLDPSAVYCWDNPIRANEKSLYLERDIQSRLNMYVNMGDITDVWIWAEETADNSYVLYIGYA